jgi:hypothetical protein
MQEARVSKDMMREAVVGERAGVRPEAMVMVRMASYDVAAGIGQNAFNTYLNSIYNLFHNDYLKGTYPVNLIGINRIDYDIPGTPTVTFGQGDANTAILNLTAPITITIVYSNGAPSTIVNATVTATISATISGGSLNVTVTSASVSLPQDPLMQEIINNAILPSVVLPQLNGLLAGLLSSIALGNISVVGVSFSSPRISTMNGYVFAYAALDGIPSFSPPPTNGLPSDKLFVIISTEAINRLANAYLQNQPPISDSRSWSFGPGGFISVEVSYTVRVSDVAVSAGGGNIINASARASVTGTLHAEADIPILPDPSITLSITASGDVSIQGTLSADPSGNITINFTVQDVDNIDVDLPGIPSWLSPFIEPVIEAIVNAISGTVVSALPAFSITINNVIPSSIKLGGLPASVSISEINYASFDNNRCFLFSGNASFARI